MKISVIMPTFNSQKFITDSLFSIKNQTYANWELIIMDNKSTDNTRSIIEKNIHLDKVKIFSEKDKGIADAINKGFKKCTGDILCWLNSDDVYLNKKTFENVVKKFKTNNVDFIIGNFCTMNANGEIIKSLYPWFPQNKKFKKYTYFNILTASLFFTKNAHNKFNSFSTLWNDGWEYEITMFLFKNFYGKYLNSFLASYRIHNLSASIINSEKFKTSMNEVFLKQKMDWSMKYSYSERMIFNIKNGILIDVIKNIFKDRYKGKFWKDLYFKI